MIRPAANALPNHLPSAMSQIDVLDLHPGEADLRAEVLEGLNRSPRLLPCKLFYDERGSALFDRICELPEYYQTRTEDALLRNLAGEIAAVVGPDVQLVEYGSGSGDKTRHVIEAIRPVSYVPIEISRWYLQRSAVALAEAFPNVAIQPVCADYTNRISVPQPPRPTRRRVAFFPGSTIGNFTPVEAVAFLKRVRLSMGSGAGMLIGVDLKKDPELLHAAYNDAAGVTAEFNLNLLRRLNHELDANFDLLAWRHYAPYNPALGRIEMHLVSLCVQRVSVAGETFDFDRGETIHTENSYKYTRRSFATLAAEAGWRVRSVWSDAEDLFSVQYLTLC